MNRPKKENYSQRETNHVFSQEYEDDLNVYIDQLEQQREKVKPQINSDAYKKLIQENIKELEKHMPEHSLEKMHIKIVLEWSINELYPDLNTLNKPEEKKEDIFNHLKPIFTKLLETKSNGIYNEDQIDLTISQYNGDTVKFMRDINKLYHELYGFIQPQEQQPTKQEEKRNPTYEIVKEATRIAVKGLREPKIVRDGIVKITQPKEEEKPVVSKTEIGEKMIQWCKCGVPKPDPEYHGVCGTCGDNLCPN